ncbi:MAG: ATP-dependent zinc metalloprotease FtsH [Hyphomicrobiales bacterium]|nr:ATP-dependent zinc metalloprotease FtsH [Hyphomicrobiales bacterium]
MGGFKNIVIWLVIGLLMMALYNVFQTSSENRGINEISYTTLISEVSGGNVRDVLISGDEITGTFNDGTKFHSFSPDDPQLIERLNDQGVNINAEPIKQSALFSIFISWFPMLLLIAVWVFFLRQMQSGGKGAMGFGKSKAKLLNEKKGKITFNDVAGIDEAKEDLEEIVEFLKDPKKFQYLGGKIPKGALLIGPPGTGKTLLARAIAGEAGVPFFTISGSDFVEMFVGVGASRVRDMFEQAKKSAPCIIFIDEIDAVGRHRGAGLGGGNDEREQTLNQLLVEMDGFEENEGIILIAATNRPDVLDPALLRPGRFDRQVVVPNPDLLGREKILKVHIRAVKLSEEIDLKVIARGTPGFSGADLANLVNEAALLAARRGKRVVTQDEFEDAKDKVMMGSERRTLVMSDDEKKLTAYHEAGHALIAIKQKASDPIHKATIIPRGRALGMVMRLPERDQLSMTKEKLKADLAVAMGGRAAEELIFGHEKVTSGAQSDIKMATNMARAMVTQFGMSDVLGPLSYGNNEDEVFLGYSVAKTQNLSEQTQKVVDSEIHKLVGEGHQVATDLVLKFKNELETIAEGLLEYETLSGQEITDLLKGITPKRVDSEEEDPPGDASTIPTKNNKDTKESSGTKKSQKMKPQTQS